MNLILGIVVVFGCVLGGFAVHGGQLGALWQPSELLIIGGAAIGALIIANPFSVTKKVAGGIARPAERRAVQEGSLPGAVLGHVRAAVDRAQGRHDGPGARHRRSGEERPVQASADPRRSITPSSSFRITCASIISGDMDQHQLEALMDLEIETHHHSGEEPAQALNKVSDSLPGFGIVAAVLGIVNTMGALGGPPEEIGIKVAAALVGTFLGILLAYGLLGPMSTRHGAPRPRRDRVLHHHQDLHHGIPAGSSAAGCDRVRSQVDAGGVASELQGSRSPAARQESLSVSGHASWLRVGTARHSRRSSSRRSRRAAMVTMAAPGKWPSPTSPPR